MAIPIPPWLQPADPAGHLLQGMRIGAQIGAQQAEQRIKQAQLAEHSQQFQQEMDAQQAAQRFKETQAARAEQMDAQQQALAEAKFNLAASTAAKKHQAYQEYQSAIAGGLDPNEAMLKFGPAMSANTGAAAAIRAHQLASRTPKTWSEVSLPSGLNTVQSSTGDIRFPPSPRAPAAAARIPEGGTFVGATDTVPAHWQLPAKAAKSTELTAYQNIMERDRAERALDKLTEDNSRFDLSADAKPDAKWSKTTVAQWKGLKERADKIRTRLDQMEQGANPAAAPEKKSASGVPELRVKVKTPEGKVGTIPSSQLQDALAHGYALVK